MSEAWSSLRGDSSNTANRPGKRLQGRVAWATRALGTVLNTPVTLTGDTLYTAFYASRSNPDEMKVLAIPQQNQPVHVLAYGGSPDANSQVLRSDSIFCYPDIDGAYRAVRSDAEQRGIQKVWKSKLPPYASTLHANLGHDGHLYVAIDNPDDLSVFSLDGKTGAERWQYKSGTLEPFRYPPSIDEHHVYVGSRNTSLYALNRETGTLVWRTPVGLIYSASTLWHDLVLLTGSSYPEAAALEKATGRIRWRTALPDGDRATSGAIATVRNQTLYVVTSGAFCYGLRMQTGRMLWRTRINADTKMNLTAPVVIGDTAYTCDEDALHAIHTSSGQRLWRVRLKEYGECGQPSTTKNALYIPTKSGRIVCVV